MIALITRVSEASVKIAEINYSGISTGLLILLGITTEDTQEDIDWLSHKIVHLRIFSDDGDKMNLSVKDVKGDILLVSQFTLCASTKKGHRPSYMKAAKPDIAHPLYERMIEALEKQLDKKIRTGKFGSYMNIHSINDGPTTIYIDTKNK